MSLWVFVLVKQDCNPDRYRFLCNNSRCIRYSYRCDGRAQCSDGSDEDKCGKFVTDI